MNIITKTKNVELTDSLKSLVDKKIGALAKFVKVLQKDAVEVFVELEKETKHHRKGDIFLAEATLHLPGKSLVARSHGQDLGKAILKIKHELEREIRKYKTKTVELPRRKYRKVKQQIV